jgi:hypothetical protein
MPETKDGSKPRVWFPDINYLLLALLAGTLFITQEPFHESRPRNPEPDIVHQVNARPWQDPFEAMDYYVGKAGTEDGSGNLEYIRDDIDNKAAANGLGKINAIAVMLPGGVYYEDGETRRKLRYAVLSGFNAALRYMPENSSHIQFFNTKDSGILKSSRVAYEWLIYPPTRHGRSSPVKTERAYERPPVLVLWLNNDDFVMTPHEKIKHLIDDYLVRPGKGRSDQKKTAEIGSVAVLGPLNSGVLQDLAGEMASTAVGGNYRYYSPSATVWECNFLWDVTPDQSGDYADTGIYPNLQAYFDARKLPFLRVAATDWDLALTVKSELQLRGITPGKRDRILLIGEWDSLYTWHLTNTFRDVFTKKEPENRCVRAKNKEKHNESNNIPLRDQYILQASYLRGLDGEKPNWASGAAKPQRQNERNTGTGKEAADRIEESNGDGQFDYIRRLAAQTERLDQEIRNDTNWNYHEPHAIKAIGVLGSDAYDKLLIIEALHGKFPDAVFFTNGFDARLTEPKNNEWARNLIIASGYGLTLHRDLQKDIPPFRDDIQTAFFLATQMALAEQFDSHDAIGKYAKEDLFFENNIQSMLRTSRQTDFDKLLMPGTKPLARRFEVGRTRSFDLSTRQDCAQSKPCLHPEPLEQNWSGFSLLSLSAFSGFVLFLFKPSREFLGQRSGLWFIASMAVLCWSLLAGIRCGFFAVPNGIFDGFLMLKLTILGGLYAVLMYAIVCFDKKLPFRGSSHPSEAARKKIFFGANLAVIATGAWIIWLFVRPYGLLNPMEPYALWEGVSLWPSQAIRFFAFILAGFFILRVSGFPRAFSMWLKQNKMLPAAESADFPLLNQWRNWREKHCKRNWIWGFIALFSLEIIMLWFSGFPGVPFRGEELFSLNILLLQGLLLPASLILLVLVSDAVIAAVALVECCLFDDADEHRIRWPSDALTRFSTQYEVPDSRNHLNEWISVRFIGELTRQIYGFIGSPLIVALLLVLACSSYFDNWIMPFYMKLSIGFCVGWLLYWDQRLKRAADTARENALATLRLRAMKFQSQDRAGPVSAQLERLISMIENDEATVYKPFTQRPIFMNTLLIMVALLADSTDYFLLASKLLGG